MSGAYDGVRLSRLSEVRMLATQDNWWNRWVREPQGRKIVAVADLARKAPELRRGYRCIVCGDPMVIRSGTHVRCHAAHKANAVCASSGSLETANHLAAKFCLLEQLRDHPDTPCLLRLGPNDATAEPRPWLAGRRSVDVEVALSTGTARLRPDIMITDNEGQKHFIEVKETHGVDTMRRTQLTNAGASWIEVHASDIVSDNGDGWTLAKPLVAHRWGGFGDDASPTQQTAPPDSAPVVVLRAERPFALVLMGERRFSDALLLRSHRQEDGTSLLMLERRLRPEVLAMATEPLTQADKEDFNRAIRAFGALLVDRFAVRLIAQPWIRYGGRLPPVEQPGHCPRTAARAGA